MSADPLRPDRPIDTSAPVAAGPLFRLAEVFYSVQGEGILSGTPSVFVRYAGCPLRCRWCDTPYASWSPAGRDWSLDEILRQIACHPTRYAVVTGGEPFLFGNLGRLTATLAERGYHVTIETAGTTFAPVHADLMSLSPKLSNSTPSANQDPDLARRHEAHRINLDALRDFIRRYDYQVKFVIDTPRDIEEVEQLLGQLAADIPPERVLLMPQGTTREELRERSAWLVSLCLERGYRLSPRLHIELFGNRPGT
jgi:7-carboxy-7-deazaguanine synthase